MNVWTWIIIAVGFGIVSLLIFSPAEKANRKFEQWRIGGKSMLEDYDRDTKDVEKFSR